MTGSVALLGAMIALAFLPARAPVAEAVSFSIPEDDEVEALERIRIRDAS